MTYVIAEPCIDIKDLSCIDVCPVDCIHVGERMLVIDPEECIDCGACEPECPVEAIFPEDALPEKWEPFVKINAAFNDGPATGRRARRRVRARAQRPDLAAPRPRRVALRGALGYNHRMRVLLATLAALGLAVVAATASRGGHGAARRLARPAVDEPDARERRSSSCSRRSRARSRRRT